MFLHNILSMINIIYCPKCFFFWYKQFIKVVKEERKKFSLHFYSISTLSFIQIYSQVCRSTQFVKRLKEQSRFFIQNIAHIVQHSLKMLSKNKFLCPPL